MTAHHAHSIFWHLQEASGRQTATSDLIVQRLSVATPRQHHRPKKQGEGHTTSGCYGNHTAFTSS